MQSLPFCFPIRKMLRRVSWHSMNSTHSLGYTYVRHACRPASSFSLHETSGALPQPVSGFQNWKDSHNTRIMTESSTPSLIDCRLTLYSYDIIAVHIVLKYYSQIKKIKIVNKFLTVLQKNMFKYSNNVSFLENCLLISKNVNVLGKPK